MDKMRERHVREMERLQTAIGKTRSKYLRADYQKAYNRMAEELKEYDGYKGVDGNGKRAESETR